MTHEEFNEKIRKEFTKRELTLILFNVYYNSDCIDYYVDHNCGRYNKCYKFLMKNRHLLNIEHTPDEWKEMAEYQIAVREEFNV
jgi:hypothetical protein